MVERPVDRLHALAGDGGGGLDLGRVAHARTLAHPLLRIADCVPSSATPRRPPIPHEELPWCRHSAPGPTGPPAGDFVLVLSCPDRPGIVHAVSGFLVEHGGNIVESQQFGDRLTGRFFMRVDFAVDGTGDRDDAARRLRGDRRRGSRWTSRSVGATDAVPHADHGQQVRCTASTTCSSAPASARCRSRSRPSCPTTATPSRWCASYGIPFHHIPVTPETKAEAEARAAGARRRAGVDLVVLARYMQVLSDDLCRQLAGRAINIHHSFLPSFKGARPYHQAHDRGVKLIGATAHYVTADLDEGPIIEQDVIRVDHTHDPEQLVAVGRDVEAQVLARAVRWHAENRVLLNGDRTVVFR